MRIQIQRSAVLFVAVLVGLLPVNASGQGASGGGPPGLDRAPRADHDQADRKEQWSRPAKNRASNGRSRRSGDRRARGPRSLHIPKGHRPPRGLCRLWYPGHPPGQQPAPMDCRIALRKQQGSAVVVTHEGRIYGPPAPRWHRRPAEDIVFRRPPRRDEGMSISVEILIDLLGRSGVRHLEAERRRLGLQGALSARWVSSDRTGERVLHVRAGEHPLAKLVDRTGDGRIEGLYVRRNR